MPGWLDAWKRIDWDPFTDIFGGAVTAWVTMLLVLPAYPILWSVRLFGLSLVIQTAAVIVCRIIRAEQWRRWYEAHNKPATVWLHEDDDLIRPTFELRVGTRTAVYTPPVDIQTGMVTLSKRRALDKDILITDDWTPLENGFSKPQWARMRRYLLEQNFAIEKTGRGELKLTGQGRAVIRHIGRLSPTAEMSRPRARA